MRIKPSIVCAVSGIVFCLIATPVFPRYSIVEVNYHKDIKKVSINGPKCHSIPTRTGLETYKCGLPGDRHLKLSLFIEFKVGSEKRTRRCSLRGGIHPTNMSETHWEHTLNVSKGYTHCAVDQTSDTHFIVEVTP